MKAPPAALDPKSAASFFRPMAVGIVLLNLLVVGATALSLYQSRIQYDERAAGTTRNLAEVLERYVDGVVDKVDLALLSVADEAEKQLAAGAIDGAALDAFVVRQFRRQPDLDSLRISDVQGNVVYGIGVRSSPRIVVADRDYFIRLRDDPNAGLVISKPLLGRISGKKAIVLARRIKRPDGSFGGVIYAVILVDHFYRIFSTIDVGAKGAVGLRNEAMAYIARYPQPQNADNNPVSRELRALVANGQRDATYFTPTGSDNVARMVSYRKIAEHPLVIIVGLAKEDYLAPWRGEVLERAAYVALFALISLFWAWMFYRVWVRKVFADRLEQQVQERTAQLRSMAVELTMVEERERQAIAQDLHDDLGQTLAIAKLKLTTLEGISNACQDRDGTMPLINEVENMIDRANGSVRSLSRQLSPPVLHQLGLLPALEWLADEMYDAYRLQVRIHDDEEPKLLDQASSNMLFRAVRELLINVHKHAKTRSADVSVSVNGEHLIVSVTDGGAGFDAKKEVAPSAAGGYGLFSVSERIGHFGGEMQIDSSPDDGTVVVLIMPLRIKTDEVGK